MEPTTKVGKGKTKNVCSKGTDKQYFNFRKKYAVLFHSAGKSPKVLSLPTTKVILRA